jgi:hypothetical protein
MNQETEIADEIRGSICPSNGFASRSFLFRRHAMRPDPCLSLAVPPQRNWRSTMSYVVGIALIIGLASAPALGQAVLSPNRLLFRCTVGHCSPQTTTLANVGGTTVTISSITISGQFVLTNNCGAKLPPGASCSISISPPVGPGTFTGEVAVNDSAPNSPQIAHLRAMIKDP